VRVQVVHERVLDTSSAEAAALIDEPERMWPSDRWPRLTARGMGFLHHELAEHLSGERRVYRITGPRGFSGRHGWEVRSSNGGAVLRHTVEAECRGLMRLGWPLVVHPIHDALHEDVLDTAEAAVGGSPAPRAWSWRVRVLRRGLGRFA
jgi:hypothetical protein